MQIKPNSDAYKLNRLFENAISSGLFPGAVLNVTRDRKVVLQAAWGKIAYVPEAPRVRLNTIYDLASLTKPLVTALSILVLTARGKLGLDDTLGSFFFDAPLDKIQISIRHLLCHKSGLPSYRPFYKKLICLDPEIRSLKLKKMILAEPLITDSDTRTEYSDLGFMLLGWLIESIAGKDLADAAQDLVFQPLHIKGLYFPLMNTSLITPIPSNQYITENLSNRCHDGLVAPTEICDFRKKIICGEVHDLNAWAMGGVSGHAGLFGTAESITKLLSILLDIYKGRMNTANFPMKLLQEFWHIQYPETGSTWALGFDTPSAIDSSAGKSFSPRSIGHLGFTGTSFWMDLEQEVLVVLLTNRTFPKANKKNQTEMRRFRIELHDLVRQIW